MRVGKFFITFERKLRRWWLHAIETRPTPPATEAFNASTLLYDPSDWRRPYISPDAEQRYFRDLLVWIGDRHGAGDPPATQVLVDLWPMDKRKLEDVLEAMAMSELILGREHEDQDA